MAKHSIETCASSQGGEVTVDFAEALKRGIVPCLMTQNHLQSLFDPVYSYRVSSFALFPSCPYGRLDLCSCTDNKHLLLFDLPCID